MARLTLQDSPKPKILLFRRAPQVRTQTLAALRCVKLTVTISDWPSTLRSHSYETSASYAEGNLLEATIPVEPPINRNIGIFVRNTRNLSSPVPRSQISSSREESLCDSVLSVESFNISFSSFPQTDTPPSSCYSEVLEHMTFPRQMKRHQHSTYGLSSDKTSANKGSYATSKSNVSPATAEYALVGKMERIEFEAGYALFGVTVHGPHRFLKGTLVLELKHEGPGTAHRFAHFHIPLPGSDKIDGKLVSTIITPLLRTMESMAAR